MDYFIIIITIIIVIRFNEISIELPFFKIKAKK